MPNITYQEPQIIVDLLAMCLASDASHMKLPGPKEIAVISPWISDVEMVLTPGPWRGALAAFSGSTRFDLRSVLSRVADAGWNVNVAVLRYGHSPISHLHKPRESCGHERRLLRALFRKRARIYLVPELHAKGLVTPFGVVTGSTNFTNSGVLRQSQNANFFAYDDADYAGNCFSLKARFAGCLPVEHESAFD